MLRRTFRMTVTGLVMSLGLLVIPAPALAQTTSSNSGTSDSGSGTGTKNSAPGSVRPASGAEKQSAAASLRTGPAAPIYVTPVPPGRTFEAGRLATLLTKDGKLAWPVALTILPPARETDALRAQMDRIAAMLVTEGATGRPDPGLVSELGEDVNKLQALLRDRGDFLPVSDNALRDANGFLAKLRQAVHDLR